MRLETFIVAALANLAYSAGVTSDPFHVKLRSGDQMIDGFFLNPEAPGYDLGYQDGNQVLYGYATPARPKGQFDIEDSKLRYTRGDRKFYASTDKYERPENVPLLSLRHASVSPKGFDNGFHFNDNKMFVQNYNNWWVCDVGDGKKVVTMWKLMSAVYPPRAPRDHCVNVTLTHDPILMS